MISDTCILIVDDQMDNLLILEDVLSGFHQVLRANGGREALDCLTAGAEVDLVLLDVMMPGIDGFETCRRIKADEKLRHIPVLFLSSLDSAVEEERGLSLGAADFIHKPFSAPVVLARVRNQLLLARAHRQLRERNQGLERLVEARTRQILLQSNELVARSEQLNAAQAATISAFCSLAEARDDETGNHIRRTQNYVKALAELVRGHPRFREQLNDEVIQSLYRSAPLHDVGKVAIPDTILRKPGKLDPQEWHIMQGHCRLGRDAILQAEKELHGDACSFLRHAREIAYGHHEKWDGSGYPEGLNGDAIPLSARLMAVADVYDALISRRVYKPAFSHDKAIALIAEGRGGHFDPDLVDALLANSDVFRAIAERFRDAAPQSL